MVEDKASLTGLTEDLEPLIIQEYRAYQTMPNIRNSDVGGRVGMPMPRIRQLKPLPEMSKFLQ
jgi:hypothetical protein